MSDFFDHDDPPEGPENEEGASQRPAFERGSRALDDADWVEAIRAFLEAVRAEPARAEIYAGLIRAYEGAADEYGDPELLEQATKVCRDALELALDPGQRVVFESASRRLKGRLEAAEGDSGS